MGPVYSDVVKAVRHMPNAHLEIVSGDGQAVALQGFDPPGGAASFAALQVRYVEWPNTPIAGAPVVFTPNGPSNMAVQLTAAGGPADPVITDAQGIATLLQMQWFDPDLQQYQDNSVQCYYATGPFSVVASTGAASIAFSLRVLPAAPLPTFPGAHVSVVAGNGQAVKLGPNGYARFAPLSVAVKDQSGHPIAGALVDFAVGAHPGPMGINITGSGVTPVTVRADQNGVAVLNQIYNPPQPNAGVTAYYAPGPFEIIASVPGGGSTTFSLNVPG